MHLCPLKEAASSMLGVIPTPPEPWGGALNLTVKAAASATTQQGCRCLANYTYQVGPAAPRSGAGARAPDCRRQSRGRDRRRR